MTHIARIIAIYMSIATIWAFLCLGPDAAASCEVYGQASAGSIDAKTEDLVAIIRDRTLRQKDPDRLVQAIKELGDRKSTAAIEDLIELLTFTPSEKYGYVAASSRHPFPAITALFMIGKPALPALIRAIEKNESGSHANHNAWTTVMEIFRDELPKGLQYLEDAAAKAATAEGRERLLKAAERTKNYVR